MEAAQEEIARRAARRLSASFDPNLPALTESVLRAGAAAERQGERFFPAGTVEVATLLVTVAQLAWTIWHDLAKDRREAGPSSDALPLHKLLVRRLRVTLGEPAGLDVAHRDRLVEIVAEETEATLSRDTERA